MPITRRNRSEGTQCEGKRKLEAGKQKMGNKYVELYEGECGEMKNGGKSGEGSELSM